MQATLRHSWLDGIPVNDNKENVQTVQRIEFEECVHLVIRQNNIDQRSLFDEISKSLHHHQQWHINTYVGLQMTGGVLHLIHVCDIWTECDR